VSNILSQDEVDALLDAVNAGSLSGASFDTPPAEEEAPAEPEVPLSLYDFRRPDRVSKDQMRALQNLHEGYARQFSTSLTNFLRTFVETQLIGVDQLTYSEFVMSVSNPSCIYIFRMEPLDGLAIFEINPGLVFNIIDRLFGGLGRPLEINRELTMIEQNVINKIVLRGLDDLRTVWEQIGAFTPKIDSYETNPQFVQIAPPGETVILVTIEVRMPNASNLLSICFPYMMLESVINSLAVGNWTSAGQATPETREIMEQELNDVGLKLSTVIGNTKLTIRDLLQLQRGDVICLDKPQNSDLIVQIGGRTKLAGKAGLIGRKKAVKITSVLEQEVPGCE
jgi:flagellar motor switch protein FliM